MRRFLMMVAVMAGVLGAAEVALGADTDFGREGRTFGWMERARVCVALTSEQCTAVVQLQIGGGDGGAGASGEGAAATSGDSGATGATGATGEGTSK